MRPPGGGVRGGVMIAVGGMGSILMLSSASAPSRVPQVVYHQMSVMLETTRKVRGWTNLCDGDAAVQLD